MANGNHTAEGRRVAERKTATTSGDTHTAQPEPPRTLIQAHEALVRIRPTSNASLAAWKLYYERSVALYREIAEIDRGHHHEALYWAEREQEKADEIAAQISVGGPRQSPVTNVQKR